MMPGGNFIPVSVKDCNSGRFTRNSSSSVCAATRFSAVSGFVSIKTPLNDRIYKGDCQTVKIEIRGDWIVQYTVYGGYRDILYMGYEIMNMC